MSESPNVGVAGPDAARKKQLMAVGAAALVAVLAAVVYFGFMKHGSGNNGASSQTVSSPVPHAKKSATPSPVASAAVVPAAYTGPVGHNPFKPLVTQPTQAPATSSNSASASKSASPSPSQTVVVIPTQTATPTQASPSPTVTVTATPSPTGLPTAGQSVTLTLVSVDSTAGTADVTVKVGATTTPYNGLKPGQVFGTYFKLVSILSSDPSTPPVTYGADFEYGDQFVQLATGEWSQFG